MSDRSFKAFRRVGRMRPWFFWGIAAPGCVASVRATDFASVDTDANGGVSLIEAQVAWPDLTEEAFTAADTDGDDAVSREEWAEAMRLLREQRRQPDAPEGASP